MTDAFQSISKGVFVIPYQPNQDDIENDEPVAGPSKPRLERPLAEWYDKAFEACCSAHEKHEADKADEQLEDITEWLESCTSSKPGGLKFAFETRRIPLGIMQDTSPRLAGMIGGLVKHKVVLQGREVIDLAAGVRGVMLGLMDGSAELGKNGRSGMDEVEIWYTALPASKKMPILVCIQDAQLVPSTTLSELIYVLSLRSALPIRVLLSVSSISTFIGSITHIEPSGVEVDVLGLGARRARGSDVAAILKGANESSAGSGPKFGQDLIDELEDEERMYGGGASSVLKGIKWRLLHHSINSPLATLVSEGESTLEKVQAAIQSGTLNGALGDLFEIGSNREAQATLNPAPRVSVLHALSTPSEYTNKLSKRRIQTHDTSQLSSTGSDDESHDETRSTKRKRSNKETVNPDIPTSQLGPCDGEDLKELEVLFNLWRSAGRNVNLWDWLEGFRGSMMGQKEQPRPDLRNAEGEMDIAEEGDKSDDGPNENEAEEANEEKAARLHAVFVRFCEEARMFGLVRARGRAKRADEVVKSIGLV